MQRFTGRIGVMGEPVNYIAPYFGKIVVEKLNGERILIERDAYVEDEGISFDHGGYYGASNIDKTKSH